MKINDILYNFIIFINEKLYYLNYAYVYFNCQYTQHCRHNQNRTNAKNISRKQIDRKKENTKQPTLFNMFLYHYYYELYIKRKKRKSSDGLEI